jgi:hypothetical protein
MIRSCLCSGDSVVFEFSSAYASSPHAFVSKDDEILGVLWKCICIKIKSHDDNARLERFDGRATRKREPVVGAEAAGGCGWERNPDARSASVILVPERRIYTADGLVQRNR